MMSHWAGMWRSCRVNWRADWSCWHANNNNNNNNSSRRLYYSRSLTNFITFCRIKYFCYEHPFHEADTLKLWQHMVVLCSTSGSSIWKTKALLRICACTNCAPPTPLKSNSCSQRRLTETSRMVQSKNNIINSASLLTLRLVISSAPSY